MAFENMEDNGIGETPPEEGSNRTFVIIAGILIGITLLALICIGIFAIPRLLPGRSNTLTQVAYNNTQNAIIAFGVTATYEAGRWTATPTKTKVPPTATATLVKTAVVAQAATNTPTTGPNPATATVAALLTQAAIAQKTPLTPVPTTLPKGGFAEDVGLPGLAGLALLLIVVVVVARRMRTA